MSATTRRAQRSPSLSSCGTASTVDYGHRRLDDTLLKSEEVHKSLRPRPATGTTTLNSKYAVAAKRAASAGAGAPQNRNALRKVGSLVHATRSIRNASITADDVRIPTTVDSLESRVRSLQDVTERVQKLKAGGLLKDDTTTTAPKKKPHEEESDDDSMAATNPKTLGGAGGPNGEFVSASSRRNQPTAFDNVDDMRGKLGSLFKPMALETPSLATEMEQRRDSPMRGNMSVSSISIRSTGKRSVKSRSVASSDNGRSSATSGDATRQLVHVAQATNKLRNSLHATMLQQGAHARRERRELIPRMIAQLRDNSSLRSDFSQQTSIDAEDYEAKKASRVGSAQRRPASSASNRSVAKLFSTSSKSGGGESNDDLEDTFDEVNYLHQNRRIARTPDLYKHELQDHRNMHKEHCNTVYKLRDAIWKADMRSKEGELHVVRGEGVNRERNWLELVTVIDAAHCAHLMLQHAKDAALHRRATLLIGEDVNSKIANAGSSGNLSKLATGGSVHTLSMRAAAEEQSLRAKARNLPDERKQELEDFAQVLIKLGFPYHMMQALKRRRIQSSRIIAHFLRARKEIGMVGVAINRFLRRMRLLMGMIRRHLLYLRQRKTLMQKQFEHFQLERLHYTKAVCADADRELTRMRKLGQAGSFVLTASTSKSFAIVTAEKSQSIADQPGSPLKSDVFATREQSTAFSTSQQSLGAEESLAGLFGAMELSISAAGSVQSPSKGAGSPKKLARKKGGPNAATQKPASPVRQGTQAYLQGPSSPALKPQSSSLETSPSHAPLNGSVDGSSPPPLKSLASPPPAAITTINEKHSNSPTQHLSEFQRQVAAAVPIAAPFMHNLVSIGKLGPDPHSAKTVALISLSVSSYEKVAMRLAPKVRDFLLKFATEMERVWHRKHVQDWMEKSREAAQQYDWLQHIAQIQEGMAASPAKQQLREFQWPQRPVRRAALNANEMRILVLVGYSLANQEKKLILDVTRAGGSPSEEAGSINKQVYCYTNAMNTLKHHMEQLEGKLKNIRPQFGAEPPFPPKL